MDNSERILIIAGLNSIYSGYYDYKGKKSASDYLRFHLHEVPFLIDFLDDSVLVEIVKLHKGTLKTLIKGDKDREEQL